jgi:hypothetical protein
MSAAADKFSSNLTLVTPCYGWPMPLICDRPYLPKGKSNSEGVRGLTRLLADSFDINVGELASVALSHQWVVLACYTDS